MTPESPTGHHGRREVPIPSANAAFQHIETLRRNRRKRHRHREFFVEGVRPINRMVARDWPVRAWCFASDAALSSWARDILDASTAPVHHPMPRALLAELSRKDEASELIAVAAMPDDDPERIALTDDMLVVALERPSSPGNLGTIIRSCDALGGGGIFITGHAIDPYAPEVIAATAGSFFDVSVVRLPAAAELETWIERARSQHPDLHVVGTSATGDAYLDAVDLRGPTVVLLGNETLGLGHRHRRLCQTVARIPMSPRSAASSLNVACAATVVLYEVARQRAPRTDPE